jgi:hypothetical protein
MHINKKQFSIMKKNVRQVEAFSRLLGFCNKEGTSYKPIDPAMNSTALQALLEDSQKSIQAVHNAQRDLVDAINLRHRAFDPLPYLGTRILGAMKACEAPPDMIADVNRIRLRFRYQPSRFDQNATAEQGGQSGTGEEAPSDSTPRCPISQLDFKSKITNLTRIIGLLEVEPKYNSIEGEVSIESLRKKLQQLIDSNKAVKIAEENLYNARIACEDKLFGSKGISGMAERIKAFYLAELGFNSKEFRAVKKIKFTN